MGVGDRQEIPLIPAEQSRVETVNTCVDVLCHLEDVVEQVFSSITARLAGEWVKLGGMGMGGGVREGRDGWMREGRKEGRVIR